MASTTMASTEGDVYYMNLDDEDMDGPFPNTIPKAVGAAAQDLTEEGPQFHLFPKLPIEVRLKIWSLHATTPRLLIQTKPLVYKPVYTLLDSRPTPAVLHVCRESRTEFLYRNDEAANNADTKSHAMYARLFPDQELKINFFSFEIDALHLMTCRVAEPVVRKNLRTIAMGPSSHLTGFFKKFDELRTPNLPTINHLRSIIHDQLNGSWYVASERSKHTLLIGDAIYPERIVDFHGKEKCRLNQALSVRDSIKYNFLDLLRFPALETLIVMVSRQEKVPAGPKKHIVWKMLLAVKALHPEFKLPDVQYLLAY